jgi:Fe-S-cluster containining protein
MEKDDEYYAQKIFIDELRSKLPDFPQCRKCGECCGPTALTFYEFMEIISFVNKNRKWGLIISNFKKKQFIENTDNIDEKLKCPCMEINADGTCTCGIYEVRPMVCRFFGVTTDKWMTCPKEGSLKFDDPMVQAYKQLVRQYPYLLHDALLNFIISKR